ncbi:polyprenyl synthetase [Glycomyces sp. YM15]|uniref:polyprenyl synthetase n=1 Tax=Glycomyces sp. YM15 TaxID=2800446 RepID=UPI001965389F|nr:polyprenyl synthetase [Glycomyces sp. YM15]
MTSRTTSEPEVPESNGAVLIAAGVADLVVNGITTALGLLGRNDGSALAEDGITELKARGRLALDRYATAPPAYLEVLAQHVETGRGHRDR